MLHQAETVVTCKNNDRVVPEVVGVGEVQHTSQIMIHEGHGTVVGVKKLPQVFLGKQRPFIRSLSVGIGIRRPVRVII